MAGGRPGGRRRAGWAGMRSRQAGMQRFARPVCGAPFRTRARAGCPSRTWFRPARGCGRPTAYRGGSRRGSQRGREGRQACRRAAERPQRGCGIVVQPGPRQALRLAVRRCTEAGRTSNSCRVLLKQPRQTSPVTPSSLRGGAGLGGGGERSASVWPGGARGKRQELSSAPLGIVLLAAGRTS